MAEGSGSVNYRLTKRQVGYPVPACFGTHPLPVREPPAPTRSECGPSALLLPCQAICTVPHELTLDLLALDPTIELLAISGGHCQRSVGRRISLERAVTPPDPRAAIGNRQPRRSTKGCARSRSGITLCTGPAAREGVPATVVLRGNANICPVEDACRVRRWRRRLRVDRHLHREKQKDAQETARAAYVHQFRPRRGPARGFFPWSPVQAAMQ
jgi:hypothetical protein